jgi:DNA-binding NtrC family response regulator
MPSVLIVDDEANTRRMLGRLLESEGYTVMQAADGPAALHAMKADEPDAVLLDLVLPGWDGLRVLRELLARSPELPVIMISGRASLSDAVQATKLGAFHFIEKPLRPEAVLLTVAGAVELRRARELSRALAAELRSGGDLVGSSAAMAATRDLLRRVAATDARVLVTGESGTGKELAAAALHAWSDRSAAPFVRVNSAAIPRELVESELFGHERGAFTGAGARHRGRFELASGGTLFLDEVADLGAATQAKLLRTLESGEIERVGGERPVAVDVRVIAATNRDLQYEVRAGRFREDLFYRLNVVPISMPALRDRLEDVPELVAHFLAMLHERQGLAPPLPTRDALDLLAGYSWPGNVRELRNICERLTILHPGAVIGAREVGAVLPALVAGQGLAPAPPESPLADRLDAYERGLIHAALEHSAGNVAEAARRLQTDRANLYRRMKRLGITR